LAIPVLLDTGIEVGAFPDYEAQVLQSPELQPEQEPPVPATLCGTPLAEVLKQAKLDILRRAAW
jgi:hypothetical protein